MRKHLLLAILVAAVALTGCSGKVNPFSSLIHEAGSKYDNAKLEECTKYGNRVALIKLGSDGQWGQPQINDNRSDVINQPPLDDQARIAQIVLKPDELGVRWEVNDPELVACYVRAYYRDGTVGQGHKISRIAGSLQPPLAAEGSSGVSALLLLLYDPKVSIGRGVETFLT